MIKRLEPKKQLISTYTDDYKTLIITGNKFDLKEFYDMALDMLYPEGNWKDISWILEDRARTLKQIRDNGEIRIALEGQHLASAKEVCKNVQRCIDAWPGEFKITNGLPTDRRCQKINDNL